MIRERRISRQVHPLRYDREAQDCLRWVERAAGSTDIRLTVTTVEEFATAYVSIYRVQLAKMPPDHRRRQAPRRLSTPTRADVSVKPRAALL